VPRTLIVVNGLPGSGKTTLAGGLGHALGAVVISKDAIKEAIADAVALDGRAAAAIGGAAMDMAWALAAAVEDTVIVESWWFAPRDTEFVRAAVARIRPDRAVEVWCDPGAGLARQRFAARLRHSVHRDADRLRSDWDTWAAGARPLGLCPTIVADTSVPVDVARLVEAVRAV
jgi:predicted kinase